MRDKTVGKTSGVYRMGDVAPNLRDMAPRHSSESVEHYTPPAIVEAARRVMGTIDLDPASSKLAQDKIVRARKWYGEHDNGFVQTWKGRVFLNPPGGRCDPDGIALHAVKGEKGYFYSDGSKCTDPAQSSGRAWWRKLLGQWEVGHVEQAVFVAFSLELLQVTQSLGSERSAAAYSLCIPRTRIAYYKPDGKGGVVESTSPPHASALVYLPPSRVTKKVDIAGARFERTFSEFGVVRL